MKHHQRRAARPLMRDVFQRWLDQTRISERYTFFQQVSQRRIMAVAFRTWRLRIEEERERQILLKQARCFRNINLKVLIIATTPLHFVWWFSCRCGPWKSLLGYLLFPMGWSPKRGATNTRTGKGCPMPLGPESASEDMEGMDYVSRGSEVCSSSSAKCFPEVLTATRETCYLHVDARILQYPTEDTDPIVTSCMLIVPVFQRLSIMRITYFGFGNSFSKAFHLFNLIDGSHYKVLPPMAGGNTAWKAWTERV